MPQHNLHSDAACTQPRRNDEREVRYAVTWVEAPSPETAYARYCAEGGYKVEEDDEVLVEKPRGKIVGARELKNRIAEREELPPEKVHILIIDERTVE